MLPKSAGGMHGFGLFIMSHRVYHKHLAGCCMDILCKEEKNIKPERNYKSL